MKFLLFSVVEEKQFALKHALPVQNAYRWLSKTLRFKEER